MYVHVPMCVCMHACVACSYAVMYTFTHYSTRMMLTRSSLSPHFSAAITEISTSSSGLAMEACTQARAGA
jgi:hypothetical protein